MYTAKLLVIAGLLAGCRDLSEQDVVVPDAADAVPPTYHDAAIDPIDGAPVRHPCTMQFGSALTPEFGRIDGILVAVLAPGSGPCNADPNHVHLQVQVASAIYDVSVNIGADVSTATRDLSLDTAFSEGWHPGGHFDYTNLVHSADFDGAQASTDLLHDLVGVNHITIFGTGYAETGAHLIHRNHGGLDGAIVTKPLSPQAHVHMFRFSTQTF